MLPDPLAVLIIAVCLAVAAVAFGMIVFEVCRAALRFFNGEDDWLR